MLDTGTASNKIASLEKRSLMVVYQFLQDQGLNEAFEVLEAESGEKYDASLFSSEPNILQKALTAFDQENHMKKLAKTVNLDEERRINAAMETLKDKEAEHVAEAAHTMHEIHQANVLCVAIHPFEPQFVASADADKTLVVSQYDTKQRRSSVLASWEGLASPVLDLAFNPTHCNLLLACLMNGSHSVFDVTAKTTVASFSEHTKYCKRGKWSPDGALFATASRDQTVRIYRMRDTNGAVTFEFTKEFDFPQSVEAIEWLGSDSLMVSVRDDCFLRTIDLKAMKESSKLNMNSKGDDHVSFVAIDLLVHEGWLLACTDRHRMIMFEQNTGQQVRNFYGAVNDSYSNCRGAWSYSGKYVYCTSQDNLLYGWSVHNERVVCQLSGHTKSVRCMSASATSELLATCSYDKTVKLWSPH